MRNQETIIPRRAFLKLAGIEIGVLTGHVLHLRFSEKFDYVRNRVLLPLLGKTKKAVYSNFSSGKIYH